VKLALEYKNISFSLALTIFYPQTSLGLLYWGFGDVGSQAPNVQWSID